MKQLPVLSCLVILLLLVPCAAAFNGPTITSISPSSGPNNGEVTVTVTGTGFDSTVQVRLNKCAIKTGGQTQAPFPGTILYKSSGSVTVVFDLTNKIPGTYDLSLNAPIPEYNAWAVAESSFIVYQASGQPPPTTTTPVPATTVVTTTTAALPAGNSVFFESDPAGASVYLDGNFVGTSPFTHYTSRKGTFDVMVRKTGYQDYESSVNILEGRNVHFVSPLTALSTATATTTTTTATTIIPTTTTGITTTTTTATTAVPVTTTGIATATTTGITTTVPPAAAAMVPRSSIVIPTPWPADSPATEKSPAGPALAPAAVVLGLAFVVLRRR